MVYKVHSITKLIESFCSNLSRCLTRFQDQIANSGKHIRKASLECLKNAGSKCAVSCTDFNNLEFGGLLKLFIECYEVTCKRRSKKFTSFRTRAVIAFTSPTL